MRKGLFLLALLAFTQNVKAADWDFTISEGEAVDVERAIAVQFNVNTNLWDYILKGNTLRVYTHHLQDDTRTNIPYHSYRINYHLNERNDVYGHYWIYTYSLTDNSFTGSAQGIYNRLIADMERTYNVKDPGPYSSPQAASNGTDIAIDIIDSNDIIIDEDENGEYLRFSDDDNLNGVGKVYFSDDSPTRLSKVAKSLTAASMKTALLGSASIPLNDVRITITNSLGQVTDNYNTNILVDILSVLRNIRDNTSDALFYLSDIYYALGFTGDDTLERWLSNYKWKQDQYFDEILASLTNLNDNVDYTDWWKMLEGFKGSTNFESIVQFGNQYSYNYPNAIADGFLNRTQIRSLLAPEYADALRSFLRSRYNNVLKDDTSWLTLLATAFDRDYYYQMGVDWQDFHRQTNIVDAVSLGRYWLNNSTNDLSSFTYWLNQQTFVQTSTNDISSAQKKFDAITNQYSQISLTGVNPSNSAENWDYWKRLEMLLAALVYKQNGFDIENIGKSESVLEDNSSEQSSSAQSAEGEVRGSLEQISEALSVTSFNNTSQNLIQLYQRAVAIFDVEGSPTTINIMETDDINQDISVVVNMDFETGVLHDFLTFLHHLFGFLWAFASIFVFWKVVKFCFDMGFKVVKFHYSLCRKILGI